MKKSPFLKKGLQRGWSEVGPFSAPRMKMRGKAGLPRSAAQQLPVASNSDVLGAVLQYTYQHSETEAHSEQIAILLAHSLGSQEETEEGKGIPSCTVSWLPGAENRKCICFNIG